MFMHKPSSVGRWLKTYIKLSLNPLELLCTIDNQCWCNVHAYVVDRFKWIPLLLNLEKVISGGNVDNLIMRFLMEYGGLTSDQIARKLICFGSHGVVVFIGLQIGVAIQVKSKVAPFMTKMHCMAHQTNLLVHTLFVQPLVGKLERLLHIMHTYFSFSSKDIWSMELLPSKV